MAFRDITAAGETNDRFRLVKSGDHAEEDFHPVLRLDHNPFVINGINCGWDRWNKVMRPIKATEHEDVWEYDESVPMEALKVKLTTKLTTKDLLMKHHQLRAIQEKQEQATMGIISLMEEIGFLKSSTQSIRMLLTYHNDKIVDAYESRDGKRRGSWDKDFPHERTKDKSNVPEDYEYALMKGLKTPKEYKKPRKLSQVQNELSETETDDIFAFLGIE